MNILKEHKKIKCNFGKVVKTFSLLVSLILFSNVVGATELTNLRYTNLPGDKVQIHIDTNGVFSEPGVFSTPDPARIAFDFFGVSKQMTESMFKVGIGNVESVVAVETDDRTRVIVNLLESTFYESQITDNGYVITVGGPSRGVINAGSAESRVSPNLFAESSEFVASKSVYSVDFRRTKNGGGKIIIGLSDPSLSVNVKDLNGEINLNFSNAELVSGLEKSLDVVDFATPVQALDVFQDGGDARIVVSAKSKYRQVSYQSGNEFTLIVDPYVETEQEKRAREDSVSKFTGEKLSINFQKIEVRAALSVIADFTGINIVTSDDVNGELTLSLKDVPWDQALDVILKTKGLGKRESGQGNNKVIFIAPSAKLAEDDALEAAALAALAEVEPLISEVIRINYANAVELSNVLLNEKEDNETNSDNNVGTVINLPGLNENEAPSKSNKKVPLKITADARSNSLVVTTSAENMLSIKSLINKLDTPLRQVLIETRIVEATDTFSRTLGAKLGFQRLTENAQVPGSSSILANTSIIGATNDANTTISNSISNGGVLNFEQGPSGQNVDLGASPIDGNTAASYALQLFKAGRGYANLISLELSALEANGNGKIVASPRLVAADNTEANIQQGQRRLRNVSGTGEGNQGTSEASAEAVLGLTVTPKITPDDRVVLRVKITQDAFLSNTIISTKEVTTQVLVDNGETIVIGGIYQENEGLDIVKVPVLGDLPILGNMFKKKTKSEARSELIIFLTPKIISDSLKLR